MNRETYIGVFRVLLAAIFLILFAAFPGFSTAAVIRFTPYVSLSEEYTDNYFQTEHQTEEEWETSLSAGFNFEVLETRKQASVSYEISRVMYDRYEENDTWEHDFGLRGILNLTRHTDLTLTDSFQRRSEISQRTGTWEEHYSNNTTLALTHQFGRRNRAGFNLSYGFDRYEDPNDDEYESISSSGFLEYWLGVRYGFELTAFTDNTTFELSDNEEDSWGGSIRLIRQVNNHFQVYLGYRHTWSGDDSDQHTVYNPSAGFDWTVSETSSVSVGAGILFSRYDNQEDSDEFFIDVNAFKLFDFSRRGSLALSLSSGYEEVNERAASLGFSIYYQGGFIYNYELSRQVSLDITGTYTRDEFDETGNNRTDDRLDFSTGITWRPLSWMTCTFSYSYTSFDTDDILRNDYDENRVQFTVTLTPYRSIQGQSEITRDSIERRIFER
ncbi:MAG: hypothetical protein D3926_24320 [Desulfobacteraceae bacterium]|nr:MAG: hypothetical protein D3926_24320 [Desulfobacteraceae bacterium]